MIKSLRLLLRSTLQYLTKKKLKIHFQLNRYFSLDSLDIVNYSGDYQLHIIIRDKNCFHNYLKLSYTVQNVPLTEIIIFKLTYVMN